MAGLRKLAQSVKKEIKEANKPFEELFLEAVDTYLIKSRMHKEEEHGKSLSIKPSSYYKCVRKLWYELLQFPKKPKYYAKSIRTLENGTVLHEWIQTQVFMDMDKGDYAIKLLPAEELPAYGKPNIEFIKQHSAPDMEVKFKDYRFTDKYPVSAMIDGFMEFRGLRMLFEFKTINPQDFDLLYEPLKDHIKQGAIYALCLGIPRVMFVYYNKGNSEMKAYMIEYNDDQIAWAEARVRDIDDYTNNLDFPYKEEGKDCQYCSYSKICKDDYCGNEFNVDENGYKYYLKGE